MEGRGPKEWGLSLLRGVTTNKLRRCGHAMPMTINHNSMLASQGGKYGHCS